MNDNHKDSIKFPVTNSDGLCPNCGSDDKLIRRYFDQLEEDGKAPKGSLAAGALLQIMIPQALNRLSPVPEVPVLVIGYEVCGACYTIYATRLSTMTQRLQVGHGRG